jgi:hypothetical protein
MKLDAGIEIWFAWQEGDSNALCSRINTLISTGYKARLPSAPWKFYTEKTESIIIRTIMLSNEWSIYMPVNWTDSTLYRFTRSGGPPQLEQSRFSYRNYIIVTD